MRRGLSYLEVLIAAGIALTGILGAIAMFPVAVLNMQKGIVVDTIASIGPGALANASSVGINEPTNWVVYNPGTGYWDFRADLYMVNSTPVNPTLLPQSDGPWTSLCFDPRFCAEMTETGPAVPIAGTMVPRYFPYKPKANANDARMLRLTLRRDPNSAMFQPLSVAQSRLLFKVSDDLMFAKPSDLPARQEYLESTTAPQRRNYLADYEYIVTLTPNLRGVPAATNGQSFANGGGVGEAMPLEPLHNGRLMSVVVFYKRQVALGTYITPTEQDPESERVVDVIRFPGNGFAGGDVIIQSRTMNGFASELEMHEGDYVMLSGNAFSFSVDNMGNPQRKFLGPQFRWYRVAATSGAPYLHSSGFYRRYVSLDGPDWLVTSTNNPMAADPDDQTQINPNASFIPTTQMSIVTGVVGVFHRNLLD